MFRIFIICVPLLLASGAAAADLPMTAATTPHQPAVRKEPPKSQAKAVDAAKQESSKVGKDVELSGISIVGNDDAPKALVIVPWKSSAMGGALDVSRSLDDGRQPVDRDVFRRELDYYQIRSESAGTGSGAN